MHILKLTGPRLEILKDAKGPYGIGFVGNCARLLAGYNDDYTLPKLVLRPDRLDECSADRTQHPVLQRILPSGIFRHAVEMKLFRALHRAMLILALRSLDGRKLKIGGPTIPRNKRRIGGPTTV